MGNGIGPLGFEMTMVVSMGGMFVAAVMCQRWLLGNKAKVKVK